MEDWQKELIVKNIDRLIELTTCKVLLLSKLEARGVLSEEEVEEFSLLVSTRAQQALKFYKILVTRENSFGILIEALRETKQSGAVSVLESKKRKFIELDGVNSLLYDEKCSLGKGSSGIVVFKGQFGNRDVAVKRMHSEVAREKAIIKEIEILKNCDSHENIVRYFATKVVQIFVLIVLELCDMTLAEWIITKPIYITPLEVLRQITVGLEWFHEHSIVHRDLKPENILIVGRTKRVKISDFGLSRKVSDGKGFVSSIEAGTEGWVAPDVLEQIISNIEEKYIFTFASDQFALGCLYYYVITDGKHPFGDTVSRPGNILAGRCMIDPKAVSHGCVQNLIFIELMLFKDPKARPSCSALLSCPLFWLTDRRHIFLQEMLVSDIGILKEACEKFKGKTRCFFDHAYELKVVETFKNSIIVHTNVACFLPFAFLYCMTFSVGIPFSDEALQFKSCLKRSTIITVSSHRLSKLFEVLKTGPFSKIKIELDNVGKVFKIRKIWDIKEKSFLHFAIKHSNFELVKFCLKEHSFQKVFPSHPFQTLIHACLQNIDQIDNDEFENRRSIIQLLCCTDTTLINYKSDQQTPLHIATGIKLPYHNGEQLEVVKLLIQNHADVNAQHQRYDLLQYWGWTPLYNTVINGYGHGHTSPSDILEILQLLFENGAVTNASYLREPTDLQKNSWADTFLHAAARTLPPLLFHEIVVCLVSTGNTKALAATTSAEETVLHHAVSIGNSMPYRESDIFGEIILHPAERHFEPLEETLEIFKVQGHDFNAVDRNGKTIFHAAVFGGQTDTFLKTLIRFGADWRKLMANGSSSLHCAASMKNVSVVTLLISLGSNVNATNLDVDTPLHKALQWYTADTSSKVHEVIKELVDYGADVNLENNAGLTPMSRTEAWDGWAPHIFSSGSIFSLHFKSIYDPDVEFQSPLFKVSLKQVTIDLLKSVVKNTESA